MHIDLITIFPTMFEAVLGQSILKRAQASGRVAIQVHDLRRYTHDKRRPVDDRPSGGGPGMVLKAAPIFEALEDVETRRHGSQAARSPEGCQVVLMAPQGSRLTQALAKDLTRYQHLVIICGHY